MTTSVRSRKPKEKNPQVLPPPSPELLRRRPDLAEKLAASIRALNEEQRREDEAHHRDLPNFCKTAWSLVDPSQPLQWGWYHELICEYLFLARRRQVRRLIINIPPRMTKSRTASVFFPAWCWSTDPSLSFIVGSYDAKLATGFNVERRTLMQSGWFQRTWPGAVQFAADQNEKMQYQNLARGQMFACGMTGAVTGHGANFLIIDDPINPKEAWSETEREAANRNFDSTFRSRLNNAAEDVMILIGQRTHEDDLFGHVQKLEPGVWKVISLPQEAEQDEDIEFPVSGEIVHRERGEPLHESRFSREWCAHEKVAMGSYAWAAQMQQRPAPLEGGIIKREWLQYYRRADLPEIRRTLTNCCISVDCAFKDKKQNSRVAQQVWGQRGADFYFLARHTDHMNLGRTVEGIRMLAHDWPEAGAKYIEDKANGPAVMEILQDEISGMIPVPVGQTEGDKTARLHAVSPTFESHHVFVPDPTECPWITDVINEWCTAPNAAGWDDTDAMTQALSKMQRGYGGLLELYKEQAAALDLQRRRLAAEHGSGAQPQEEKDKAFNRLGRTSVTATVKDLGKVMTAVETPGCPNCDNKYPAATAEGHRSCGVCGHHWVVDVGRAAKDKTSFTAR